MKFAPTLRLVVLISVASCHCERPAAILARITVTPRVIEGCLALEVTSPDGTSVLSTARFPREPARTEHRVAVFRGDLPEEVGLRAIALEGAPCEMASSRVLQSELLVIRFVDGDTREAALLLDAPAVVVEPVALAFTSPPPRLLAGECSPPLTLELRDRDGNARASPGPISLSFTAEPAAGFGVYADPLCVTPRAAPWLPAGTAAIDIHVRGVVPAAVTLTAASPPLTPANLAITVTPNVVRGTCALDAGESTVDCPVMPPIADTARAMLVFQATTSTSSPADANVRCFLGDAGTVACARAGSAGVAHVSWQLAQLAKGFHVQHFDVAATGPTTSIPIRPVDGGTAFVLLSMSMGGATQNYDDLATVELASEAEVQVTAQADPAGVGARYAVQVVELANARVTRGSAGPLAPDGGTLAVSGLPGVNPTQTFLLYSWRTPNTGTGYLCNRIVRGELLSATELFFSRGDGDPRCTTGSVDAIAWQRIELPAGSVQQLSTTMAAGTFQASTPITPVNSARSFALSGGQGAGGLARGEGLISTDDVIGDLTARHQLSIDTLTLQRDSADAGARWTSYVVELNP